MSYVDLWRVHISRSCMELLYVVVIVFDVPGLWLADSLSRDSFRIYFHTITADKCPNYNYAEPQRFT